VSAASSYLSSALACCFAARKACGWTRETGAGHADASQKVTLLYDTKAANDLLAAMECWQAIAAATSLVVIYSYAIFAPPQRSHVPTPGSQPLRSRAKAALPVNKVVRSFEPVQQSRGGADGPLK